MAADGGAGNAGSPCGCGPRFVIPASIRVKVDTAASSSEAPQPARSSATPAVQSPRSATYNPVVDPPQTPFRSSSHYIPVKNTEEKQWKSSRVILQPPTAPNPILGETGLMPTHTFHVCGSPGRATGTLDGDCGQDKPHRRMCPLSPASQQKLSIFSPNVDTEPGRSLRRQVTSPAKPDHAGVTSLEVVSRKVGPKQVAGPPSGVEQTVTSPRRFTPHSHLLKTRDVLGQYGYRGIESDEWTIPQFRHRPHTADLSYREPGKLCVFSDVLPGQSPPRNRCVGKGVYHGNQERNTAARLFGQGPGLERPKSVGRRIISTPGKKVADDVIRYRYSGGICPEEYKLQAESEQQLRYSSRAEQVKETHVAANQAYIQNRAKFQQGSSIFSDLLYERM